MKPTLPKGIYIQIYRDKIPGATPVKKTQNLSKQLDVLKAAGIVGILMHGFCRELDVAKFLELEKLCNDKGLLCIPAYGLDSSDPQGKGQKMGAVAAASKSKMLVLDMEGAWEDEKEDKAKATIMGTEIRKLAPDVLIFDQPWFAPLVHMSFPWVETASYVDVRCSQVYVNDFRSSYGKDAYEKVFARYNTEWKKLEDNYLAPKNLVKPRFPTIQGYFWLVEDLIDCLCKNETLFVWSEPYPDADFMKGLAAFNKLKALGFSGPEAVKNFQTSTVGKLSVDGIAGPATLKALGL